MRREIVVTQEDIDNGIPCSPFRCFLALAIKRAVPVARKVSVPGSHVRLYGRKRDDQGTLVPLPESARKAVSLFDGNRRDEIKPFTFLLPGIPGAFS